jgi:hypothetical protein
MQRLFSMFPDGLPGIALVLLRGSVASTVLIHGYARHGTSPAWEMAAFALLSILLAGGILTPVLALVALAVQWIGFPDFTVADIVIVGACSANALALSLLGPGAYSLDARRYGRRVVDWPASRE